MRTATSCPLVTSIVESEHTEAALPPSVGLATGGNVEDSEDGWSGCMACTHWIDDGWNVVAPAFQINRSNTTALFPKAQQSNGSARVRIPQHPLVGADVPDSRRSHGPNTGHAHIRAGGGGRHVYPGSGFAVAAQSHRDQACAGAGGAPARKAAQPHHAARDSDARRRRLLRPHRPTADRPG